MRYEVKTFDSNQHGQDVRTADQRATEWLNEMAKNNGRIVAMTSAPYAMNQHGGMSTGSTAMVIKNAITIVVVF